MNDEGWKCDWCGRRTEVRIQYVRKTEIFDVTTGQDYERHEQWFSFCSPACRDHYLWGP